MHTPVLLREAITGLDVKPGGLYIDATVGEGGHLRELLSAGAAVLAIDWDLSQLTNLKRTFADKNVRFVEGNYADIAAIATQQAMTPVDGILFDFGLSMEQIQTKTRGFSYKNPDDALDMRINRNQELTAADVIDQSSVSELADLFARYSEDLHSTQLANMIVSVRTKHKIIRVGDLLRVIDIVLTQCQQNHPHQREKVYARIFQALRIVVNHEIDNIKAALQGAMSMLKPRGRIVIVTFHSLEDRVVKNFIRNHKLKTVDLDRSYKQRRQRFARSAQIRIITN